MTYLKLSRHFSLAPLGFVSLLFVLSVVWQESCPVLAQSPSRQRPPVSWVNPDLPKGEGLTHHVLSSEALGHDVGYVVWTPPGFDPSGATKYSVIYFLHGSGGNESADSSGFSSLISRGIRDGILPPTICVFPNGGQSGYRGDVEKMIIDELLPLIDKNYPTKGNVQSRAVAGFSMGGGGAIRLSIKYPESFCTAVSWAGSMRRAASAILAAADENSKALKSNSYSAQFVNGDHDNPDAFKELSKRLTELEIANETIVLEDTGHNLGLYYQRAGDQSAKFMGEHLR